MPEPPPLVASVEHGDGVVEVMLRREGRRNALSSELLEDILEHIRRAERSGQHTLLLTGAGPHFSAGADIGELTGTADDAAWFDRMERVTTALRSSELVSIAVVQGACIGAGLELAISCDLRLAGPDAYFAIPALQMGLVYSPTAVRRLVALVGPTWATRLLVADTKVLAEQAHLCGLVTQLAAADPVADGRTLAAAVARAKRPMVTTMQLIRSLMGESPEADPWRELHVQSLSTTERHEAVVRAHRSLARKR